MVVHRSVEERESGEDEIVAKEPLGKTREHERGMCCGEDDLLW